MGTSWTPPTDGIDLAPWRQVAQRADAFFEQVAASHGEHLRCVPGCVDCCQQDLQVLLAEAVAVLLALDRLPRGTLPAVAPGDAGGACVMLLQDGRCAVYDHRPLICRTHGLPIQYGELGGADDEVNISCCALNFTSADPPARAVLNGTLLLAGLSVADSLVRRQLGVAEPCRIPLSRLRRRGWDALREARDKNS